MSEKTSIKSYIFFICENCDFKCSKRCNFEAHKLTRKHQKYVDGNENGNYFQQKNAASKYVCEKCEKSYIYKSGLSRHKKKCNLIYLKDSNSDELKTMIIELVNQNKELINTIHTQSSHINELIPKVGNTINNTNNTNNINQKFNINVFLNEQCKDAINMDEFINKIEITLDQLDITKNKGLTEGLSNVFLENMNKLSIYERPIHCTDVKRETLYIKNDDNWEKDKDNTKIKRAIKSTSNKQYKTLQQWKKVNPDFLEDDVKQEYFAKAISALGKPIASASEKIIKKLCPQINCAKN